MNPYPKEIKYSDFNTNLPRPPRPFPQIHVTRSVKDQPIKNTVDAQSCGPASIWLNSLTTGVRSPETALHKSSDTPSHAFITAASPSRYCFAPLYENVFIRWKHKNPELIRQSKLELFCRINDELTLIWTKTFTWTNCPEDARTLFKGSLTYFDEELDKKNNPGLENVTIDYDREKFDTFFPGECVTAEFSPYKLRLTVIPIAKPTRSYPTSEWVYFDIRVHDIELEWCPDTDLDKVLPNTNKARNLAMCRSLADADDNDNLNGVIPSIGQTKKVYLKSNTFYLTASELADITYYNRYKTLWEDGPVIPIFAKAKIRKSNGEGVDAPLALGKLKFMWDWVDKATDPYTVIGDASIQSWVDTSRNYKTAETADSPVGKNCHVDRGGKRGLGAKTCFPQQNGKAPVADLIDHDGTDQTFPFCVQPLNGEDSPFSTRKWAAYSYSWASGALAGKTGVLFQPSRMAGDGYELHVYLAYDTDSQMERATPATIPPGLHKNTGIFQIWRELDIIKHWRMKTTSPVGTLLDLVAVKTKFAKYFIKMNIPAIVDQTLGDWQTTLQNVVDGVPPPAPPLPDYIRAAADPARATDAGHLIPLIDYETWYRKMLVAHGPDDANLSDWANTITNDGRMHGWEDGNGNNGFQPILKPWTLDFLPNEVLEIDGTVRVDFPNVPGIPALEIKFEKEDYNFKRKTTLSADQRAELKKKLERALRAHGSICLEGEIVSYGRGKSKANHVPLIVQLAGLQNQERRQQRLINVEATLIELNWEFNKDYGKMNYVDHKVKYGWGLDLFVAVMDVVLPAQEGIVAVQATDLSNFVLPTGKAFYANAAGNRALAATLAPDPKQATFEHEIGHALFLNHTYHTQPPNDPNYLHQKFDPSISSCVMHSAPSSLESRCSAASLFCGFCIVRLWGWSFQMTDAAGLVVKPVSRTLWYDENYNQNPGSPAPIPFDPTDGTKQEVKSKVVGEVADRHSVPIITGGGTILVTVTAAGLPNSPKTFPVAVAIGDTPSMVASKVANVLSNDGDISSFFKVRSKSEDIHLITLDRAANDPTMNIALAVGTCVGMIATPISTYHIAGKAPGLHPLPGDEEFD